MPAATGPVRRTPTTPPTRHRTPTHHPTSPTKTDYARRLMACRQQTAPPQQRHSKDAQPIHTSPGPAKNPHTPTQPTAAVTTQPKPRSNSQYGTEFLRTANENLPRSLVGSRGRSVQQIYVVDLVGLVAGQLAIYAAAKSAGVAVPVCLSKLPRDEDLGVDARAQTGLRGVVHQIDLENTQAVVPPVCFVHHKVLLRPSTGCTTAVHTHRRHAGARARAMPSDSSCGCKTAKPDQAPRCTRQRQ